MDVIARVILFHVMRDLRLAQERAQDNEYSAVSGHLSAPVDKSGTLWKVSNRWSRVVPACHADQRFGFGPGLGTYAGGQSGSRNDNLQCGRLALFYSLFHGNMESSH